MAINHDQPTGGMGQPMPHQQPQPQVQVQPQPQPQPQAQPQVQPQVAYADPNANPHLQPNVAPQGKTEEQLLWERFQAFEQFNQQYSPNAAGGVAPNYGTAPQAPLRTPPSRSYGSGGGLSRLMQRPSNSLSLQVLEKSVRECMAGLIAKKTGVERYGNPYVMSIDSTISQIPYDILAVYCTPPNQGTKKTTLVQLMILDGSTSTNSANQRGLMDGNTYPPVDVLMVPGDFLKKDVKDRIGLQILNTYVRSDNDTATIVGHITIPANFGISDQGEAGTQKAVNDLVFMATSALMTAWDIMNPIEANRISLVSSNDKVSHFLDSFITFSDGQVTDSVGQPIRSDVTIDVSLAQQSTSRNQLNIATVHGYMDMMYAPPMVNGQTVGSVDPYGFGVQQNIGTRYLPVFVMTAIRSRQPNISISDFLVALAGCACLSANRSTLWMNAFQNITGVRGELRNIRGVLNEVSLVDGQPPLGKDSLTGDVDANYIIQNTFVNNLFYALDIEESGETTWLDTILLQANTDPMYRAMIVNAADDLTNGTFSRMFGANELFVGPVPTRMHLGQYYMQDQVRDIRDLDTLTILNESRANEIERVRMWVNSITQYGSAPAQYLNIRENAIRSMLTSVNINRYAKRVVIDAKFISTLTAAIIASGVPATTSGVSMPNMLQGGLPTYDPRLSSNASTVQPIIQAVSPYGQHSYYNAPPVATNLWG